ncbi:MAG: valine--tRNA ligase [Candidatus Moraniibacteriota bacterium]|nr:MAG: valine--tRNA ligase [Candidatus Moranbacteria bacterium]
MKQEIPKTYEPRDYEDTVYQTWEKSGFFNPDTCIEKEVTPPDATPFSIVLPPPNVTGTLHLGHAAMLAIEDIMVRYHRMRGDRTLWLPGTDHAAIATQEKVERILWNEEQKTRHDLGREVFLDRVRKFAQDSHDTIVNQCKKMGASLDWSREAYTLDEARNRAVNEAFRRMFEDGIIYRGPRIVNWDPKFQTTVSDDEVDRREEKAPFYYLQYGPFVIGTARPETKFGDKYVVVHPDDERYAAYQHGQKIENIEWINGTITATLIKDEAIDMNFGTGAMTITPWHDATDFDIAERHNLEKEQVIGYDGKLLDIAGEFAGMDISEARTKIVEKLRAKGLVTKTDENYIHNVAINSRGGGIIEPQIKEQWFIDVNKEFNRNGKSTTLKSLMQNAVRSGDVNIIPERFKKTYFHWIDHLRDWCISRQIWYGHRIPVWYHDTCQACDDYGKNFFYRPAFIGEEISRGKNDLFWCPNCGNGYESKDHFSQDPDTLDTWFSSGLWTFSTLGWGSDEKKWEQEKIYHPTSVLETGCDILFFWVARMILMSEYLLGEAPFKTAYLHGLVKDEQGRKMSKSIGNVINPLDVSAKYGTDAVRLSLVIGGTPGNDIRLGEERIASFRNFANKLWNIGRYVLQQEADNKKPTPTTNAENGRLKIEGKSDADHWILFQLDKTVREVTRLIEKYQFSLAGETLRDFTWNEFADWYVEIHKVEKNNEILRYVFETLLKLWHPFMPFVTETLWENFEKDSLLMIARWPEARDESPELKKQSRAFSHIIDIITAIRNSRSENRIPPKQSVDVIITGKRGIFLQRNRHIIEQCARVNSIDFNKEAPKLRAHTVQMMVGETHISMVFETHVDLKKEKERLEKELTQIERYIKNTDTRLKNESFLEKAPAELIENTRAQLREQEQRRVDIQSALKDLL